MSRLGPMGTLRASDIVEGRARLLQAHNLLDIIGVDPIVFSVHLAKSLERLSVVLDVQVDEVTCARIRGCQPW